MNALRNVFAAIALGVLATAAGAGGVAAVDDVGVTVELDHPARRIVSLAPHATELVFAAGAGDRLVGVVKGSDHPAAAAALPVVGDVQALDLERIVALRPDLVVTWPYTTPPQVAKLRAQGIAVFTTDPRTPEGIADDVRALGALAGTAAVADGVAASLRERLRLLRSGAQHKPGVRTFYQIWGAPIFTVGGGQLITQALQLCGGENVMAGSSIAAPQVGIEAVIAAHPDLVVAGTDGARRPAWLDAWTRWSSLPAVRYGNLEVVDADRLHRPGPRFVDGVAELCAVLDRARERMGRQPAAGTRAADRPS